MLSGLVDSLRQILRLLTGGRLGRGHRQQLQDLRRLPRHPCKVHVRHVSRRVIAHHELANVAVGQHLHIIIRGLVAELGVEGLDLDAVKLEIPRALLARHLDLHRALRAVHRMPRGAG